MIELALFLQTGSQLPFSDNMQVTKRILCHFDSIWRISHAIMSQWMAILFPWGNFLLPISGNPEIVHAWKDGKRGRADSPFDSDSKMPSHSPERFRVLENTERLVRKMIDHISRSGN